MRQDPRAQSAEQQPTPQNRTIDMMYDIDAGAGVEVGIELIELSLMLEAKRKEEASHGRD
jgi:hypothetical protein